MFRFTFCDHLKCVFTIKHYKKNDVLIQSMIAILMRLNTNKLAELLLWHSSLIRIPVSNNY